ncbi:MAG: hypothetical protein FJ191_14380, partial [Gammaproteobacteria bacterium]|nr:hypothetical protein [Gammaproteobacteria bacterium]
MTAGRVPAAFSDPLLLGGSFAGPTWSAWRALIAGAFGQPLDAGQRAVFRELTAREPPGEPVRELWIVAGRRGGKSRIAAGLAVALAACHDWPAAVGEVPAVLYLAADREQARVAFGYARGLLRSGPLLAPEVGEELRDRIVLRSGVELQIATADHRRVRGRSLACAVLDEVAHWPTGPESVTPDVETVAALRPALATFEHSLLIAISTPYAQRGVLFEMHRRYFGQPDARVLVARAPSRVLNPSLPEHVVAEALSRDPQAAGAEYLAQFRSDVASFLDAELVDSLTRSGPRELSRVAVLPDGGPPVYVAALDVSGGRGDATAAAVAHREGQRIVVDAVRRWPAPHDPATVAVQVATFLDGYGLSVAASDRYAAEISRSLYRSAGVTLVDAPHSRSDAYLRLLPMLTAGRVELPPEPVLRHELLGLERRTR